MPSKKQPNFVLLGIVASLIIFGLFMVTSAGMVISQEKFSQSFYFAKNQIIKGLLPGLLLGFIAFRLPYPFWRKMSKILFVISIILMILVFLPKIGLALGGAHRWISLGSFSFQPSEILKLTFVIYLAAFLEKTASLKSKQNLQKLFFFCLIIGLVGILLWLEPDLGTLGIFCLTALIMYFASQAPMYHIFFLSGLGFILLFAAIKIFPHASQRVQTLLHPGFDPGGIGYQMNQGLIALGSGGLFGEGLAQGKQKFLYLPQPASDSIVAVIGEELGFIGLLALISLFATFALQGLKIAGRAPDQFSRLLAVGLTSLIIVQATINIAAVLGLIPLTGITLPFVSYGGTSLVMSLIAVGMLLNISKYSK